TTLTVVHWLPCYTHAMLHLILGVFVKLALPSFFFNGTPPTEIYTLSLHDALPILPLPRARDRPGHPGPVRRRPRRARVRRGEGRSEEHTSELQSRENLVCRLLLEKKKKNNMLQ